VLYECEVIGPPQTLCLYGGNGGMLYIFLLCHLYYLFCLQNNSCFSAFVLLNFKVVITFVGFCIQCFTWFGGRQLWYLL